MSTRDQILEILRRQRLELGQRYPIKRLALFGSWVRGDAREDSDIDILVDIDPSVGLRFVQLADELEQAFGRKVDVVSRRAIRAAYWKLIEPELVDA